MQVRISKPTKSAMQSGEVKSKWLLEFIEYPGSKFKESLMGRTSSCDMSNEVKIYFFSLEQAINFVEKRAISYEIIQPKERKFAKKSYSANFK